MSECRRLNCPSACMVEVLREGALNDRLDICSACGRLWAGATIHLKGRPLDRDVSRTALAQEVLRLRVGHGLSVKVRQSEPDPRPRVLVQLLDHYAEAVVGEREARDGVSAEVVAHRLAGALAGELKHRIRDMLQRDEEFAKINEELLARVLREGRRG